MGARTSGREAALQMLFGIEAAVAVGEATTAIHLSSEEAEKTIAGFWRELPGDPEGRDYADRLVRGVAESCSELDDAIRKASTNWRLERMARVDRNILRLGAWELRHREDVPRAVILDEAVELAKRFGSEESSAFVNGVLDRIAEDAGRVDRDAPPPRSSPR